MQLQTNTTQTSPQQSLSHISKDVSIVSFVEVTFGMPSRDCRGYGICKIDALSETNYKTRIKTPKPVFNKALATLHTLNSEVMILKVRKFSLDKYTLKKHFGRGVFEVREAIFLELPEVCYLPTRIRTTELLSGDYPVYFNRDFIFITMKVQSRS